MAWSATDLSSAFSSAEYSAYQNLRPVLLTHNALSWTSAQAQWTATGALSADDTDALYPGSRAYDDQLYVDTRPDIDASTIYFAFTLDTSVAFDALIYDGIPPMAQGYTFSLEIADDSAFTSNLQALTSFGVNAATPTVRQYIRTLAHTGNAKRYSGTAYGRIKLVSGAGNFNPKPRLTEVFLGRTHQLEAFPDVGSYAPFEQLGEVEEFKSKSGVVTRYARARGQRRFGGSIPLTQYDSWNRLLRYHKETDFGRRNTWVVETPTTGVVTSTDFTAQGTYPILCASPLTMRQEARGPYERQWEFEFLEVGPYFASTQFQAA